VSQKPPRSWKSRQPYRNLLKQIHPDTVATLSPDLRRIAEGATEDIIEAYSVLSDASKRRQYDREFGLGEHRLKSVRPPAAPYVPRSQHVRPQTSPADSSSRPRRLDHYYDWADRHPVLAGLLVFVFGILYLAYCYLVLKF
jgi:curved DNA-binding protein CbpA